MDIQLKRTKDIVPYENNSKRHTEKQIQNVAKSIEKYGFVQPIVVDKNNVVVIGHCRLAAAKKLGYKEVPCVSVDDLTDEQVKALRIVDNKTNESEWDIDSLFDELPEVDLSAFDFDFFDEEPEGKEEKQKNGKMLEEMELKAFEHYDYVVFVFKNSYDWLYAANELGLKKVDAGYGKTKKLVSDEFLMEKNCLKELDIKILILSRGRSEKITTVNLVPEFIEVLVPESEKELYAANINNPILTVSDDVRGLGQLRNWVLDNFKEETVIMLDDDLTNLYCLTGEFSRRITDPDEAFQVIVNTAVMAMDSGAKCFGFAQTDIRKYNGTSPFRLSGWIGAVVGVIGRDLRFRKDKFKVDIDFCLKNLLYNRYLWIDDRYYFSQNRNNNTGGNSLFRTDEEYQKSLESLKRKWGSYLKQSKSHKNDINLKINVKRKQDLDI